LKKRSKKLSFTGGFDAGGAYARRSKSFLLLFFKKEALSFSLRTWMPAFVGMTGAARFGDGAGLGEALLRVAEVP
jgi:hypothetical protein